MATKFELQQAAGSLVTRDPAAVAAAETAKAKIQAGYLMALQKPRDEDEARAKILKACRRIDFAQDVEFKKPQGGQMVRGKWEPNYITGLSIRFAEVALKEWGNVLTETQTLYEDDFVRRVKVSVTDLETNITHSREPQLSKTVERRNDKGREVLAERVNSSGDVVYIVRATDDEMMTKENAIISKVVRNEGLRLIPNDIKIEAIRVAKQTLMNDAAGDPDRAKKQIVDSFAALNIMPRDLSAYLKHGLGTISPRELDDLRGIYKAIKDGESTWQDFATQDDGPQESFTDDFDKEFKDISGSKEFKAFWAGALAHYNKSEAELKANVMASGPGKLRMDFDNYLRSEKAKDAKPKPKASTKKTSSGKTASKTSAATKKKELEALHQSDEWQEYQLYKAENSDIWKKESGGKDPVTIAECADINDRIQASLDALDSAEGMPE